MAGLNEVIRNLVIRRQVRMARLQRQHLRTLDQLFLTARARMNQAWGSLAGAELEDVQRKLLMSKLAAINGVWASYVNKAVAGIIGAGEEAAAAEAAFWNTLLLKNLPASLAAAVGFSGGGGAASGLGAAGAGGAPRRFLTFALNRTDPKLVAAISEGSVLSLTPRRWGVKQAREFSRLAALELATAQGFGESVAAAGRRLTLLAGKLGRQGAEDLARNVFTAAAYRTSDAWGHANADIVKGFQYVATLDTDTCLVCGQFDGRFFPLGAPRPALPNHSRCRCVYTVITKGFRELGLDLDDIPPRSRSALLKGSLPDIDGGVPAATSYTDWLRALPAADAQDALGSGRYAAWVKAGKPWVGDFVEDGRELTVETLSARL